jgi:hypothetical protein
MQRGDRLEESGAQELAAAEEVLEETECAGSAKQLISPWSRPGHGSSSAVYVSRNVAKAHSNSGYIYS